MRRTQNRIHIRGSQAYKVLLLLWTQTEKVVDALSRKVLA